MLFKKGNKKQIIRNDIRVQDFLDMNLPGYINFGRETLGMTYAVDDTFRSVWAVTKYPITTENVALLRRLGEMDGVHLHIYMRNLSSSEGTHIVNEAMNNSRLRGSATNTAAGKIGAAQDQTDIVQLIQELYETRERLAHVAVFIECVAHNPDELQRLQSAVKTDLAFNKITVNGLTHRQKQGFQTVNPVGMNKFGDEFERIIPISSAANLFPFSYNGKMDPHGFRLGRDKYGTHIFTDFDRRAQDISNPNIVVLGNPGEGKSYLGKGILANQAMAGKNIIILDPEHEYEDLVKNLGGEYMDLMSGEYKINVLECRAMVSPDDNEADEMTGKSVFVQHLSFLKNFFRAYKITDEHLLDVLEIVLLTLYEAKGIDEDTDFTQKKPTDYPVVSELIGFIDGLINNFDDKVGNYFSKKDLSELRLSLHSISAGVDKQYFDGYTNIHNGNIIAFGMKGVTETEQNLKSAMLYNTFSYMNDFLLKKKNAVAMLDEFYLFLGNRTAVEQIRNCMKRVRKVDSSVMLLTQNIEDFNLPGVAEYTKPLLTIPSHAFLFYPGRGNLDIYKENMRLNDSEMSLVAEPHKGECLYMCGSERYALHVEFDQYITDLFGNAGGR